MLRRYKTVPSSSRFEAARTGWRHRSRRRREATGEDDEAWTVGGEVPPRFLGLGGRWRRRRRLDKVGFGPGDLREEKRLDTFRRGYSQRPERNGVWDPPAILWPTHIKAQRGRHIARARWTTPLFDDDRRMLDERRRLKSSTCSVPCRLPFTAPPKSKQQDY